MSHQDAWIAGFFGVGGAVIGTIGADALASRARARERREKLHAGCYSLSAKILTIYEQVILIRNHFTSHVEDAKKAKLAFLFLAVIPYVRASKHVEFTIDEIWAAGILGREPVINATRNIDVAFNNLALVVERYERDRKSLSQIIKLTDKGGGWVFDVWEDDARIRALEIAEIDQLAQQIVDQSTNSAKSVFAALTALAHGRNSPLGDGYDIGLQNPAGEPTRVRACDAAWRQPKSRWARYWLWFKNAGA